MRGTDAHTSSRRFCLPYCFGWGCAFFSLARNPRQPVTDSGGGQEDDLHLVVFYDIQDFVLIAKHIALGAEIEFIVNADKTPTLNYLTEISDAPVGF